MNVTKVLDAFTKRILLFDFGPVFSPVFLAGLWPSHVTERAA